MKKLILSAFLISAPFIYGQDAAFGIKGGINFSDVSNIDAKEKVGFHLGFLANIPLAKGIKLQPELIYNGMGTKDTEVNIPLTGGNFTLEFENNHEYVSMPVMLQYEPTKELYLETGPQFSLLVNDTANKFDFSWGIGLGVNASKNFGIGIRYTFGLTNIYEESNSKNRNFQIGINYNIQ